MKINKVEIQAFKTYLHKNEGTFDFTISASLGDREAADFVSIYAPNGFGKTSFYDAVDFAITQNITRYVRDTRLSNRHNKDAKHLNEENSKQYLIRNRVADTLDTDLETSVSVFTDMNEVPFKSPVVKAKSGNKDYHFKDSNTPLEMRFFRDVMLTQEMIDTFLRETSPEDRYEKFSQNPTGELKEIESQRKQLSRMRQYVSDAQKDLEKNKESKTSELQNIDYAENPFDEANKLIDNIEFDEPTINSFESPYIEADKKKTFDQISIAKNELDKQKKSYDQDIEKFNNFLVNIDSYQLDVQELTSTKTKLEKTVTTMKNIEAIESLEKKNSNILILLKKQSGEHAELESYKNQVTDYVDQYNLMNKLSKELTKAGSQKDKANQNNEIYKSKIQSLVKRKIVIEETLESLKKTKLDLPSLFTEIVDLKNKSSEFDKRISEIEPQKDSLKKQMDLNKQVLTFLKSSSIERLIGAERLDVNVEPLNELHKEYSQFKQQSVSNQENINDLETELQTTQLQANLIADLIAKSSEIIAETQQSDCPLCLQPYESFERLKQKIYENPALSQREKALHQEIQGFREKEQKQADALKNLEFRYKELKQAMIESKEGILTDIERKILKLEQELSSLKSSKIGIHDKKIELLKKTADKTQDEFKSDIEIKINNSQKMLTEISAELDELEKKLSDASALIEELEKAVIDLQGKLELKKIIINQFSIHTHYMVKVPNLLLSKDSINSELAISIQKHNTAKKELENEFSQNKGSIKKINSSISKEFRSLTKAQLQLSKKQLDTLVSQINNSLLEFNAILRTLNCKQPDDKSEWIKLCEQAKLKLDKLKEKIQNLEGMQLDLELLEKFSEESVNFSQRLDIESELNQLKLNISKHQKIYKKLSDDLLKTNEYIQKIADSYFKTELINQIYRAIDPHPEYRKIEFKCHIPDDGRPQLNITAHNSADDVVLPNLNFSSAQINVLSLSIFLARALTTTDNEGNPINCIFIDDPIQSMDSINVLSLIDLFRNISSRFGKQLIISTHDENFHELLKKKIPPNMFRSKYLRLASFGQVAYD